MTDHTIRIGGQTINYKATASTTLLKDDKGEPTALMYSTAYTRSDVKDFSQRPIAFIYNGGPGSASVWLHMGAFGPRRVVTENASATPPAPYKVVDNTESLLDKTDMVFIDPVGTGFSRAVGKAQDKDFWGVDQDVRSLAQFISTYVSRNNRWNSPKFLIGESYGTFRSVALGNYLQTHEGMYINGIVLISSVLDAGTLSFSAGDDRSYIFYVPTYAATAWYYKLLKNRPDDLDAFVESARQFASTEYAAALMKGSKLTDAETADIAKKLSAFHRPERGLSDQGGSARRASAVQRGSPAEPRPHDWPLRFPLYRPDLRPADGKCRIRSVVHGCGWRVHGGVQQLRARGSEIRAGQNVQGASERAEPGTGIGSTTSGSGRIFSQCAHRRGRFDPRADRQSAPAGAGRERIFRYGHSVFRHGIHDGPSRCCRRMRATGFISSITIRAT